VESTAFLEIAAANRRKAIDLLHIAAGNRRKAVAS